MDIRENRALKKTTLIGASLSLFVATLGTLGYVPGLEMLGRVNENFIPMAPSTAAIFYVQGLTLFGLAFDVFRRQARTLFLMLITFLTAIFGLLEVPGDLLGMDLNFENRLVPPAGQLGDIPIARMSPLTGALFFLAGLAILFLLIRCYSQKDRPAHTAGILGSLVFGGSFVATLGYLMGTPLLYEQGTTVPIALTTAFAFLWLAIAIVAVTGQNSFPLLFVTGPSTRTRLMRAFLPVVATAIVIQSLASLFIPTLFLVNRVLVLAITISTGILITGVVVSLVSVSIGRDIDQTNEALRASEERFSLAFHYDPDVIIIASLEDTKMVDVNEGFTRLTGITKEQAIGKYVDDLGLWASHVTKKRFLETIQKTGTIHDFETTIETKFGDQRVVVVSAGVVKMENKPHVILVARDITNHRKAENALRKKTAISEAHTSMFSVQSRTENFSYSPRTRFLRCGGSPAAKSIPFLPLNNSLVFVTFLPER